MKMRLKQAVDKAVKAVRGMTAEDLAVIILGASFFVGVWYAFPMVNTITDVWAFGGGVLRAMEAGTLFPGSDVAYGTVSFYQNYAAMAIALVAALPFYGFDIEALKTALVLNPAYTLMVSRLVSALSAVVLLAFVYRFLRSRVDSSWWRLALLALSFGNVLATLLVRSGKMWVLSIGLCVISFMYLHRALTEERPSGKPGSSSFISILTASLAVANFTFAGLFLINIPILLLAFPKTKETFVRITSMAAGGVCLVLVFFAMNAENTVRQLSEFVIPLLDPSAQVVAEAHARLTFLQSLAVNGRQAAEAFPLLLLALLPALLGGVRDRLLAHLSLLYGALYIIAVAVVFRTDHGLALNIRHIFPLGFFLMFFLAAHRPPARLIAILFLLAGFAVYAYTLILLSIPTTYNQAYDFVSERYGSANIRIEERIFELTLPMNKASYGLYDVGSCGSTCAHMRRAGQDIGFRPVVTTGESAPALIAALPPPDLRIVELAIDGCTPVARFGNTVADHEVFDIDINLGRMLMPAFYRLDRLGKNVYIYDGETCDLPARSWTSEVR